MARIDPQTIVVSLTLEEVRFLLEESSLPNDEFTIACAHGEDFDPVKWDVVKGLMTKLKAATTDYALSQAVADKAK